MNRRSFITKALAGLAAVPLLSKIARAVESGYNKPIPTVYGTGKYGRIGVDTHPELCGNVRVFIDGKEVSNECFEADDINGYALCYKRDRQGAFTFDRERGEMVVKRLTGDVKITPGTSFFYSSDTKV